MTRAWNALLRAVLPGLALLLSTMLAPAIDRADLMRPLGPPGRYTFQPNQMAAAEWYKPAGRLINGHIEESFGNEKNWPEVHRFLQETAGAFGIFAPEIGYLSSDWLLELRRQRVRVSVETPAWTQCASGNELARAELFGSPVDGRNIFQSTFQLHDMTGRSEPFQHGWFFTKDGRDYAPDEIVLDHRILTFLPNFDTATLLTPNPDLSWQARKDAARRDPCPAAETFDPPGVDRLTGVLRDYIDYARAMAQKFPVTPALSLHWNVVPQWEWGDEQCLDELHDQFQDMAAFASGYLTLARPCHRDAAVLERLIDMLCQAGTCPGSVFMDIDLTYRTAYALEAMRRDRTELRKHGVAFGVDLADQCNTQITCVQIITSPTEFAEKSETVDDVPSENMLYQRSMVDKFEFLIDNGIIDLDTRVRFESWSVRPIETKEQTAEDTPGSFANTVRLMTRQFIVPRGWTGQQKSITAPH